MVILKLDIRTIMTMNDIQITKLINLVMNSDWTVDYKLEILDELRLMLERQSH